MMPLAHVRTGGTTAIDRQTADLVPWVLDPHLEVTMTSATTPRRRFLLVFNPTAGTANQAMLDTVAARMRGQGASIVALQADGAGDVVAQVRRARDAGGCDAILAAGGDGTIRLVAAALDGSDMPVGIIPLGTGNVLANEIGLLRRPGAISRMLLEGPTVPVTGARANGEPFLLMCGVGFDGRIIANLSMAAKTRLGQIAYARPVLKSIIHPLDALEIEADGEMHYASWVIVANCGRYGGRFVLTRRTHVSVPGLQLVLFKSESRVTLLRQLLELALGRLDRVAENRSDIAIIPCRQATIRANQAVAVQIDGDPFGTTPVQIESGKGPRINLIVPGTT